MNINNTDAWIDARRIDGLRRFAVAITVFNLLGHTLFGFEQSWAQPLVSLAAAYVVELFCEWMEADREGRRPRFLGGAREFLDFLLPAHITGLAVSMLLYASDHLLPIVLATTIAIASKNTLRLKIGGRMRHFLNPSNFGITAALLLFPWVGIAPPYHFTENLGPAGYWILPAIICISGTIINYRFTQRIHLVAGWLGGFVVQAALRSLLFSTSCIAALNPLTGVAFVLFSFYMVTDPATTPWDKKGQVLFGFSVAAVYGLFVCLHVVFGFFFALTTVSGLRGLTLYARALHRAPDPARISVHEPATVRNSG